MPEDMIDLEIKIGRGLGPILFGWTESELHALLGPPDGIWVEDFGDPRRKEPNHQYNRIRSRFCFDEDGRRC